MFIAVSKLNRIQSVDIFRLLAIIAVISLHTLPFVSINYNWKISVFINQAARFAVPFFFVITGYFWGVKIRRGENPILSAVKSSRRISLALLFWCVIYLVSFGSLVSSFSELGFIGPVKDTYRHIVSLTQDPLTLAFRGTQGHLWFLISIIISITISSFFIYKKWIKRLILISIVLYVFGVFSKSYIDTPLGIDLDFNSRNGPFFSTLLFVTGYLLSGFKTNTKWLFYGCIIFILGSISHFSEIIILAKLYGTSLSQDYVFGILLIGVGIAVASLSNHPLLQSNFLGKSGQMTLGIYAYHVIFVSLLSEIDKNTDSIAWEIGYVL